MRKQQELQKIAKVGMGNFFPWLSYARLLFEVEF